MKAPRAPYRRPNAARRLRAAEAAVIRAALGVANSRGPASDFLSEDHALSRLLEAVSRLRAVRRRSLGQPYTPDARD